MTQPLRNKDKSKSWVFTINNYTDDNIKWLRQLEGVQYLVAGKEVGEKGTPHLQGFVTFKKASRFNAMKKLFNPWHIEMAKAETEAANYAIKDAKNGMDEVIRIDNRQRQGARNDLVEAKNIILSSQSKTDWLFDESIIQTVASRLPWAEKIWQSRPFNPVPAETEWYPWQKYVITQLETDPDERSIHFIIDSNGHNGKTKLAKYLRTNIKGGCLFTGNGDFKDKAFIIVDTRPRWIIFNIVRDSAAKIDYEFLESCKDGLIVSTKYVPVEACFKCPHVFVFMNTMPELHRLSNDRPIIHEIDNETKDFK